MSDSENWSSYDNKQVTTSNSTISKASFPPFNGVTFKNKLIFGGVVGFASGVTFGMLEVFKNVAGDNKKKLDLKPSSMVLNINSMALSAAKTGGVFGTYFLGYQGIKYGIACQRGEDDCVNAVTAGIIAGAPFMKNPIMRHNIPYAAMLVLLDHFHEEISSYTK